MRTPEKTEKDKTDCYLKEIGAHIVKPRTGGYGTSGDADRICCIAGVFWSLEIKRLGGTPTALQCLRMKSVEQAGGKIAWGTADDIIPIIVRWLQHFACGGPHYIEKSPHAVVPRRKA